ncbi:hypothetical protein [Nannocystis punicea]|uniref:Uncharacterized protein n=1 Tax=Nannocystis punicea TaxID=2995304 RepID=A0ABY7HAK5_9BACT|nr:hypothetical protein [Nannocystis poenicansa]WAS96039.1 hypothetical protein O0S08_07730 [Nannocystis poenicansa]
MLKGLRVPTHRVDAPGQYVLPHDGAWDKERITAERAELAEMALAKLKTEAVARASAELGRALTDDERATAEGSCVLAEDERERVEARHPVPRYLDGDTRFDPQALDQSPRGPVRAFDYFREGAEPTIFHLRRVGFHTRMRIEAARDASHRFILWVKAGVEAITCGTQTLWQATEHERELSDEWLESISSAEGGALLNIVFIAGACSKYSRPLDEAEGKR